MKNESSEFFRISSGLKSLIGSELITDIYVAVFELVKNSFDAQANKVTIAFKDIYNNDISDGSIIIEDDGKGMSYDDLLNKWLRVAYSAKREGTEDTSDEVSITDYRKRMRPQRYYAGAKGVGRFSCDRLGSHLKLITRKDVNNATLECLEIDWSAFDQDSDLDFINIPVKHTVLDNKDKNYTLSHGTILEITGISAGKNFDNDNWSRESLLKLKDHLSKLIRPDMNQGSDIQQQFSIELIVPEEKDNDEKKEEELLKKGRSLGEIYRYTVNGFIRNFVFDALNIKTTKIIASVSEDGAIVTTRLEDRGNLLYEIIEENKFRELKDVIISIYFLNRSAKLTFMNKMGVETVRYGNIFVYKNGFRIFPYGEPGDDSLGIDNRGMQGYNRFITSRNIVGQIDIQGKAENLYETTSRNGGLVKTNAFYELTSTKPRTMSLLYSTLRRLEKYVVDVTDWGINDEDYDFHKSEKTKERLVQLLANIVDSSSVISANYNPDIIEMVNKKGENSAKKLVSNFKRMAQESNNKVLYNDAIKIEEKINLAITGATKALKEKDKALKERDKALEQKNIIEKKIEQVYTENLFLRSDVGMDKKTIVSLQHHIGHTSNKITILLRNTMKALADNDIERAQWEIGKINLENEKIATVSNIVSKANFKTEIKSIHQNLVNFVNEYINNIYQLPQNEMERKELIDIQIKSFSNDFIMKFSPIDVIIIIDNLINNSEKAKATKAFIYWELISSNCITLHYRDNGIGIKNEIIDKIFNYRFTTTGGGGLGLYHVKDIITKMGGAIIVNNKIHSGVEFIITFKR